MTLFVSGSSYGAVNLVNGDFETGADQFVQWPGYVGGTGDAGTNPAQITGWTGDGGHGINPVVPGAAGDSPFDDPSSWNSTNFAFLQGVSHIEQTVTGFSVGAEYLLSVDFNSRGCCGGVPVTEISFNGTVVAGSVDVFGGDGAIPTAMDPDPWYHADLPFTAPADSLTIRFATSPVVAGTDATLVLDNIQITQVPEPSTGFFVLLTGLAACVFRRRLS